MTRDKCHINDANNKGWDRDNERKCEPVEKAPTFAKLHVASTFLERRWVVDRHIEWGRVCVCDGRDDCPDREHRRFGSVRDLDDRVRVSGYRFYDCNLGLEVFQCVHDLGRAMPKSHQR